MSTLLEEFLLEARDFIQEIGECLMRLESEPANAELLGSLFRMVHTLKGNSGLFDFPEMTRVLHASEDLMDSVRDGRVAYSAELADRLLEAIDFVGVLLDEAERGEVASVQHAPESLRLSTSLRALMKPVEAAADHPEVAAAAEANVPLAALPEAARIEARRLLASDEPLFFLDYRPAERCFFHGEDPLQQARTTPGVRWGSIAEREPWAPLAKLDPYHCNLHIQLLSGAPRRALEEHYDGTRENVRIARVEPEAPSAQVASSREDGAAADLVAFQRQILALPIETPSELGRLEAVAAALRNIFLVTGGETAISGLTDATARALESKSGAPLTAWLDGRREPAPAPVQPSVRAPSDRPSERSPRRADDANGAQRSVKVDAAKIDRLMNLIGEMVVAKNALPYLAARAEEVFGVRELSREIKAQYAIMNRIADEMQDAIMQVRMMPVASIFQRFPRLVRDTSRKLGKNVELMMEGEETAADKNVIESLGDPMVHIIRNSLDHGFELPEVRKAAGKPESGTLVIRARQEADRVLIEVEDDGKGMDPEVIKRKAFEKGIIDEAALVSLDDQQAVNLVFASGFSTMDVVSELSGRGVGMDVVKSAVEKVKGTISLESKKGKGTLIRLSLPLSMSVTSVMIIEANGQPFGVPMDRVVETVRVRRGAIRTIKNSLATVLRDRIVPLKALNELLQIGVPPKASEEDELAVLVVRMGGELVGLVVDDFSETLDIILKPMTGVLASLRAYSGSALMGDGSVLMVLDIQELIR